jgi:ribulose-bisphosphate carboxylase large chain
MQDVLATYYFMPRRGVRPEEAAEAIAEEETTGTWTDIGERPAYVRRFDGIVERVEPQDTGYVAKIRYPGEVFEAGNIPQYLSVVAGNLFGIARLDAVRLLDIEFPEALVPFRGPKFGIEGVRRLAGTQNRPHIGTPEDTATLAFQAAVGGVDLIKDDKTLTDQPFCPLDERVALVMERLEEAKSDTGRYVFYAVNVSTRADEIVERAERVIELGANMIMVDVAVTGLTALQALAEDPGIRVPIHVPMTRWPEHGIATAPIARFVRMLGGDQFQTGPVSDGVQHVDHLLTESCYGFKKTFPVSSGGLHPGKVYRELFALGTDIVLQAEGAVYDHPDGTTAGARAMRQAVDAYMEGVPIEEYAQDHYELERALQVWGTG